ncbi:FAD:protein FMN transferase [Candidatus Poribacteria bacterium]|nr:MAG: FAD:protein FMN transferase [Candidatus Poribacteria bacterium]
MSWRRWPIPILIAALILAVGCGRVRKFSETRELMGTWINVTVYSESASQARRAIDRAFEEMERVDRLMSTYKEDSEVSRLNRDGFLKNPSPDLRFVIERSLYYSKISNGAFDITVQPILKLYSHTFKDLGRPPTEEEIEEAMKLVGYENVVLDGNEIRFRRKGVMITLGGIAKGYAIDKAIEAIRECGIRSALVNAGGDVRAIGLKPGGEKWRIALQNPRNEEEYITVMFISDKAVATSGDYERYFDPNKKYHHIINPKTGRSAVELISVTVIADKAIDADALATSAFVLGPEEGLKLIERIKGAEGLLITRDRRIIRSSGFDRYERKPEAR